MSPMDLPRPERWQLPAALGVVPIEGEVADRMVRQGLWFTALAAAAFAGIYQVAGPAQLVGVNLAASVALLILTLLPLPSRVKLYAAVAIALALLGAELSIVGTIVAGITVWFLVPNVAALLAGLRQAAAACLAITIAEIGGIALGVQLGWFGPPLAMPSAELDMALSMVGTLTLCALFAVIVLRVRYRLVAEVEAGHAEVERARAEAVAASEAKDRFFANLTHEIRTPLNGIAGTAELLRDADLSPDARSLVNNLVASTSSLVTVVNAMLDHARLDAGAVEAVAAPVDVRRLLDDVRSTFAAPASAKGLRLALEVDSGVPGWVEVDGLRLGQAVANLVGNAVKFTEQGEVEIHAGWRTDSEGAGRLAIAVSDTGPGIAPDRLDEVFQPFVQGDSSIGRVHGGTGLGLAIARRIAGLLGGTLTAESSVGVGSRFLLSVPARETAAVRPPAAAPAPQTRPGVRVLLAEDNDLNRSLAVRMLQRLGASVDAASGGGEAVTMAAKRRYDLVLMDIQMPEVDGITAARLIRESEAADGLPAVRIVAMTGNSPEEYGSAASAAGMDAFLVKPVSMDDLRACLSAIPAAADDPTEPEPALAGAS